MKERGKNINKIPIQNVIQYNINTSRPTVNNNLITEREFLADLQTKRSFHSKLMSDLGTIEIGSQSSIESIDDFFNQQNKECGELRTNRRTIEQENLNTQIQFKSLNDNNNNAKLSNYILKNTSPSNKSKFSVGLTFITLIESKTPLI